MIIKAFFSEIVSEELMIPNGISKIIPERKDIIIVIINEITRNDQKFFEPALKNSPEENLPFSFLRLSKRPPVRKALIKNPVRYTIKKPAVKKDKRLFIVDPRSVKTAISNSPASFSVIILVPKADPSELLNGYMKTETKINRINQIIRTPFHDLRERRNPV